MAVLLMLAGATLPPGFLAARLLGAQSALVRVVAPGRSSVELGAGEHVLFLEHESVLGGRVYRAPETVPGLSISLVQSTSGHAVALTEPAARSTYAFGSHAGTFLHAFRIDEPGAHELVAHYPEGDAGPEVVLAVSPAGTGALVLGIACGALVSVLLVGAGVTVLAMAGARRRAFLAESRARALASGPR